MLFIDQGGVTIYRCYDAEAQFGTNVHANVRIPHRIMDDVCIKFPTLGWAALGLHQNSSGYDVITGGSLCQHCVGSGHKAGPDLRANKSFITRPWHARLSVFDPSLGYPCSYGAALLITNNKKADVAGFALCVQSNYKPVIN